MILEPKFERDYYYFLKDKQERNLPGGLEKEDNVGMSRRSQTLKPCLVIKDYISKIPRTVSSST